MTSITIHTFHNPSLGGSYYDSETRHRTVSGAVRRLMTIARRRADWRAASGDWGRLEIAINRRTLDDGDLHDVDVTLEREMTDPQGCAGDTARHLRSLVEA